MGVLEENEGLEREERRSMILRDEGRNHIWKPNAKTATLSGVWFLELLGLNGESK
jgi:hypothetical protein